MKTCECGGTWLRHGKAVWHKTKRVEGVRYRCKSCGKCITVREGELSKNDKFKRDWRFEVETSRNQQQAAA